MIREADPHGPCSLCGVNPWTDCRHRPGIERADRPVPQDDDRMGARPTQGLGGLFTTSNNGLSFLARKAAKK